MLAVRGLSKSWGAHTALHPIDLTLETGEAVALLGANGSGKSTLLSLVSGLRIPSAGEATWNGANTRLPASRSSIGVLPERPALPPHHCLRALFDSLGASGPIEALSLEALMDRRLGTLSAGQRQRASLALALAGTPQLLLLDEPLNALDTAAMDAVVALVQQRVSDGCALLLATHHPQRWPFVTKRLTLHEGRRQ